MIFFETDKLGEKIKECVTQLEEAYKWSEENRKEWRDMYNELRDEYDKDADIAALKSEIADLQEALHRGFRISEEEDEEIKAWREQHENERHGGVHFRGCSGGGYTYYFVPTGIGTAGTIRCSCGEEFTFRELG